MKPTPILPGSAIGVLGSGQLGRMLAMVAKRMGYKIYTYSPDENTPAGQICDQEFTAAYEDTNALQGFARQVDVITFEFENIPTTPLKAIQGRVPIYPNPEILYIAQNRLREKTFLAGKGFPVVPFYPVSSRSDLTQGLAQCDYPLVLKTAGFGYDGKGQAKVGSAQEAEIAFEALDGKPVILERFIDFQLEFSVIAARNPQGEIVHYAPIENIHQHHILDISLAPGRIPLEIAQQASKIAQELMETLNMVGVLCIEFFLTTDGRLLINELAPRPHNSGHLTIEAAITSQFEQQLRAICGLPLGACNFRQPAAMANLLGDLWEHGEPAWEKLLAFPEVKLHLYGKAQARAGRKMGHLTTLSDDVETAFKTIQEARSALKAPATCKS